jgi:hypothetical protein
MAETIAEDVEYLRGKIDDLVELFFSSDEEGDDDIHGRRPRARVDRIDNAGRLVFDIDEREPPARPFDYSGGLLAGCMGKGKGIGTIGYGGRKGVGEDGYAFRAARRVRPAASAAASSLSATRLNAADTIDAAVGTGVGKGAHTEGADPEFVDHDDAADSDGVIE